MSRSDDERLADIVNAAEELAEVVEQGHDASVGSPILRRAAECLLEIVGEGGMSAVGPDDRPLPEVAWRDIRRLLVAHHYHRVDPEQVWVIATEHVPRLITQLDV